MNRFQLRAEALRRVQESDDLYESIKDELTSEWEVVYTKISHLRQTAIVLAVASTDTSQPNLTTTPIK
jgi:hypothetical protein